MKPRVTYLRPRRNNIKPIHPDKDEDTIPNRAKPCRPPVSQDPQISQDGSKLFLSHKSFPKKNGDQR